MYSVPPLSPPGKRWVIPDLHGCARTFDRVLEHLQLSPNDQLFLLGDYVNKGPGSREALERVMELVAGPLQVFPLRGNHEQIYLELPYDYEALAERLGPLEQCSLFDAQGKVLPRHIEFIKTLPLYYELESYLLVHAGLDFSLDNPYEDANSLLNIRRFPVPENFPKTIIHGHHPHPLDAIQTAISDEAKVIPLDNGCVYVGEREDSGNLLALELNTRKLIIQPYVDPPRTKNQAALAGDST
ncbi:MAG: metallophosphoesterase family protein [Bacteroidota bacterium]